MTAGKIWGPGAKTTISLSEREKERQAESQLTDLEIEWNSERMHRKFKEWRRIVSITYWQQFWLENFQ